jgi:hypothetical protein
MPVLVLMKVRQINAPTSEGAEVLMGALSFKTINNFRQS